MDEKTKKLIKERFDALPEMIQGVILSSEYENSLLEIGKKYNLTVEQMGMLEQETTLAMMGLNPINNFEVELTREMHVNREKGSQIVKDINNKIFLKIRDLLKLMNTPVGEEPSLEETSEQLETQNINTQVLNSAGIQILDQKELPAGNPTTATPINREEMLKNIEKPELIPKPEILHPIWARKLTSSFQTPVTETKHSLTNISPAGTTSKTPPDVLVKKVDPYREMPE